MTTFPMGNSVARNRVREFLADQERLRDTAREKFFVILEQYGVFRAVTSPRTWRYLLLISLMVALTCGVIDGAHRQWLKAVAWAGYFLFSLLPILKIRRYERRANQVDHETEWRAYCLFLRPVILSRFPGLLDRNLASLAGPPNRIVPRPRSLLRDLFVTRGLDYWWSALVGLWCSMGVLLILQSTLSHPPPLCSILLPVLGFFVGPIAWALGQALVYFLAQKGVDDL